MVKIVRVVPDIPSQTDRQTDRHTGVLITIFRIDIMYRMRRFGLQYCHRFDVFGMSNYRFTTDTTQQSTSWRIWRVVEYFTIALLRIYCYVWRWKNFENRSVFVKARDKNIVAPLFPDTVYLHKTMQRINTAPHPVMNVVLLHHTSAAHQVRRAGFSFSGPSSWNSLPVELRTISDTNVFKNKLKTTFLSYHLTFSRLSVYVLCIPDFSMSVLLTFINFYCSAPFIYLFIGR